MQIRRETHLLSFGQYISYFPEYLTSLCIKSRTPHDCIIEQIHVLAEPFANHFSKYMYATVGALGYNAQCASSALMAASYANVVDMCAVVTKDIGGSFASIEHAEELSPVMLRNFNARIIVFYLSHGPPRHSLVLTLSSLWLPCNILLQVTDARRKMAS